MLFGLVALAFGFVIGAMIVAVVRGDSNVENNAEVPIPSALANREPQLSKSVGGPVDDDLADAVVDPGGLTPDLSVDEIDGLPEAQPAEGLTPGEDGTRDVESAPTSTSDGPSSSQAPASSSPSSQPPQSSAAPQPAGPNATSAPPSTERSDPTTTTTEPRSDPTTTMAPESAVGSAFTTNVFTEWPVRNTSLDSRTQLVNTPASQIAVRSVTEGSDRTIALGSVAENKHLGQFRTQCSFSHFNYDDPLVNPGQPGRAHLHMYFGNTQANASSTYRTLRDSGSSSCNGFEGNRSAYWIPAVFDGNGNVRIPSRIELYYKSHDRAFSTVEKPPEGLGMVAGRAADNPFVKWACQETGAQGENLNRPIQQQQNTIPACGRNATLLAHIQFPQCLGGSISETSGNATAQMSYPRNGYYSNSCAPGAKIITSIEYFIAWAPDNHDGQTQNWWLSSDVRADGTRAPNGSTLHGDWFGGWNPLVMDQIHQRCVARLAECGWDLVDDNRRLTWVEHFGPKNPAAYTGPKAIPARQISERLCPGEHFDRPEDAAYCGAAHSH